YILLFICVGVIPVVLLRVFSPDLYQDYKYFSELSTRTILALVSISLWNVLDEELLFRSILWKILNDWKFSNNKIILIQAVLFGIVHFRFISNNTFGFPELIFGIWVGFLALRSKSLTPSITTHFVHNITSRLF
ncbi:MAG TPA: CPBP family intramembrane glutamic endopeptidase, partial [Anaerolineales bacterium]|nr:CPBP family intramembrane glutamic endopeptidase [Anaerolineales bacterium]